MPTWIAIDAGTTNTRAWRVEAGRIVASDSRSVGVRDTARDGNNLRLQTALRELIAGVRGNSSPVCVAAAGMITSALGLREIVHCDAPAGIVELAAKRVELSLPEICDLPIWLFTGVRSGDWANLEATESCDMMRGEETLCLGLAAQRLGQPLTVLNLGSHWKAIEVSASGQIVRSWTTLSGELLQAIMTQTILASAVPTGRPEAIDHDWCRRGSERVRHDGFSRTLFETRLWEVRGSQQVTPTQRLSFLLGALIEEAWGAFSKAGNLLNRSVVLIGQGGIAAGWEDRLSAEGVSFETMDSEATAECFIRGIARLVHRCRSTMP